jgi:hypothetical protein
MGWQKPPLVSSRPTDLGPELHGVQSPQDVDARLWQDPFGAVKQYTDEKRNTESKSNLHSIDYFRKVVDKQTLLLGVTLSGAPYPEVAENRRRLRYAVLAGLHVSNYIPEDAKHIGYFYRTPPADVPKSEVTAKAVFNIGSPTGANPLADGKPEFFGIGTLKFEAPPAVPEPAQQLVPAIIPFEVFHNEADERRVTVLWLDEDELAADLTPLANIFKLMCSVDPSAVAVLGPQDSTTLKAMNGEIEKKSRPTGSCGNGVKLHLFNYGATADLKQVLNPKQWSSNARIGYFPTVSSDKEVAETLACELQKRQVALPKWPDKCPDQRRDKSQFFDHIALISEWDTVYGRSLHETMSEALGSDTSLIDSYSYMRGLDGRSANRKVSKSDDAFDGKDNSRKPGDQAVVTPDTASQFESAEGQSQFDYLRRIAEKIRDRHDGLLRSGKGRIAAIGILGSDVYDKLLILQALKPILPDVVYFTTDLDELLLPQKKSRYTRNLLVGSSYGLTLRPELQGDVAPFRSSYQSSIFLATQLAVRTSYSNSEASSGRDGTDDGSKLEEQLKEWSTNPPLFQIGRTAPWMLPSSEAPLLPSDDCYAQYHKNPKEPVDVVKCSYIRPPVGPLYTDFSSSARFGVVWSPLLLGLLFSLPGMRKVWSYPISGGNRWAALVAPALLFLGFLVPWVLLILDWPHRAGWLTEEGNGEPMSLFEGISIWPTVALSCIGIVLSLFLIWYTLRSLEINDDETATDLALGHEDRRLLELRVAWRRAKNALNSKASPIVLFMSLLWFPPLDFYIFEDRDGAGRKKVWYSRILAGGYSGKWQIRCIRAASYTALMMLVCWAILFPIFGAPNVPARGDLARAIYLGVTFLNVGATLFLTFLVVDATLYSRAFVARLMAISTVWPGNTLHKFKQNFGLADDDLADWIDINYLARRTSCITQLIYFPFMALALLILSRNELFDNFSMPWTLPIAQAICLGVIITSVAVYRSTAEAARKIARDRLVERITATKRVKDTTANQLETLLNEVENLKDGAFAPLTSQPMVKALLLPLLTYGGTLLVHLYALPGT